MHVCGAYGFLRTHGQFSQPNCPKLEGYLDDLQPPHEYLCIYALCIMQSL
jgi:hypothetical protein